MVKISALVLLTAIAAPASSAVKNPDTYTELNIGDADSLDPAWSYDVSSDEAILNIYETLFIFEGASTEKLAPLAAVKVPSRANGLISKDGKTYVIPIRAGMKFHDGAPVTPEDVRYSILRFLLQDRDAGPSSLLLEPLLGYTDTRDPKAGLKPQAFRDAAKAVSVEGGSVVLRLPKPFAPLLGILAKWSPVVSKAWAVKNGDWNGEESTWAAFNNPKKETSPFYQRANGSGPFKLARWDRKTQEIVLERNDGYWRKPAKLKRVIIKSVSEFGTRKLMLQAGDADSIYALEAQRSQLQDIPGVVIIDNLSVLENNPSAYFTFRINAVANPFIGSGKLDGRGIPEDFFADKRVRQAFAHAFDYKGFIRDVRRGKGRQTTGAVPPGLLGHNPAQPVYAYDPAEAARLFQIAHDGRIWEKGFEMTAVYNSGNTDREAFCRILKRSIEAVNPKFRINIRPLEWPTFMDVYKQSKLPLFLLGWQADYPDPHNFAFPLLHSRGTYSGPQGYANPEMDRLIEAAIAETTPAKRKELYFKIQRLEHEDIPHMLVSDLLRFRCQRSWVKGWTHNPIFPNAPWGTYFYPVYKAE